MVLGGVLLSGLIAVGVYLGAVALATKNAMDIMYQPAVLPTFFASVAGTPTPPPPTARPGEPTATPAPTQAPAVAPAPTQAPEILPEWRGTERINVLLMGVDQENPTGTIRSDTMILVSIDPVGKRVGMISMPRDLLVSIPGHGQDKINAAYSLGEQLQPAGGGPALAMQTVRENFRVPVHHYATVDFRGFTRIVDAVGGIIVEVPYPIKDDEYPTDDGSNYTRLYVPAGLQHLDGLAALRYARTRHFDSDFGRQRRQQQVLQAIREQGLKLNLLPRLPEFITLLSGAVRHDFNSRDIPGLVRLGASIPPENIKSYGLSPEMTIVQDTRQGYYLIPVWARINAAFREMLGGTDLTAGTPTTAGSGTLAATATLRPKATATPTATPTATARAAPTGTPTVQPARLRVAVRNGTFVEGLAARKADILRGQNYTVMDIAQDPNAGQYPQSVVYNYGASNAQALAVARALGLPASAVKLGPAPAPPGTDIVVILGDDAPQ